MILEVVGSNVFKYSNIRVMAVLTGQQSVSSMKAGMSPTSSTEQNSDRQFGIICSEKHARVSGLYGDLVK